MKIESFNAELNYNNDKIVTKVILETAFSKEIRILLKQGQIMKEHKAPFPIVVHVLEGTIDFGVEGKLNVLRKGSIITLDSSIPHDLTAQEDSIVRLTLLKQDDILRVNKVIEKS